VFAKPALDLLVRMTEVAVDGLHDRIRSHSGRGLVPNRHRDCQPLFPRDFFGRGHKIFDGIVVQISFAKWRGIPAIKELTGLRHSDVDPRSSILDSVTRASRHQGSSPRLQ